MRLAFVTVLTLLALRSVGQTSVPADDFSITLERIGCLGNCPDYKIQVLGNGSVRYEGRHYVRIQGVRTATIPKSSVQKLFRRVREEHFFEWEEKKQVCVDYPEVNITATLNGQRKHVVEGCNSQGEILRLAAEIDRISGATRWVGSIP
jgi:hypothetical protein